MVVPAFGFSVGDFVAVTKLLITLFDSFKESGGAATKYTSEKAFLASLTSTVLRLSHYVQNTPHDEIAREILSLLEIITEPLKAFRAFLNKHAGALEKLGTASGFSKTRLTMSFTMKEISGKVEKLRREIEQPIHAVNSLLALQVLKSIENAPKEPLRQEQLGQIVEAIRMADIPAELGKQIGVLQRFAAAHGIQNTEHVQRVMEMRETIVTCLDGIHATTKQVQEAVSENQASLNALKADHQTPRDDTIEAEPKTGNPTKELHSMLREQKDLLLALRSFLEDKVAAQERASQREKQHGNNHMHDAAPCWPRKTLTTAQLAMVLLSAIVPNIAAATLAMREHQSRNSHRELLAKHSRFPSGSSSQPPQHPDFQHLHPTRLPQRSSLPPRPPNTRPCASCGTFCPSGVPFCTTCIHIGGPKRIATSWVSEFGRQRRIEWVAGFEGRRGGFRDGNGNGGTGLGVSTVGEARIRDGRWSGKMSKLGEWDGGGDVGLGGKDGKCGWGWSAGFVEERSACPRSDAGKRKSTEGEVGRENGRSSGDADTFGGVEESTREDEGKKTTTTTGSQKSDPGATKTSSSSSSPGSRGTISKGATSPRDKVPNRNYPPKRHELGSRSAYHHGGSNSFACSSGAIPRCGSSDSTSNFANGITACSDERDHGRNEKLRDDGLFG